jgi:hypothetical protein
MSTTKRMSLNPMADKKTAKIGEGKPGPGRPKGMPNKSTALLKDAILKAATDAGNGDMSAYLLKQATDNAGPFLALLGKVLPMQVDANVSVAVTFNTLYEPKPDR